MSSRILVLIFGIAVLGFVALEQLQSELQIGRFAVSPQVVTPARSQRMIVGGGRAILGVVGWNRNKLTLDVQCKDTFVTVDFRDGEEPSDVGCGIKLRWLGIRILEEGEMPRVEIEVSWDAEESSP